MKTAVTIVLVVFSIALVACALVARRSHKPIALDVALLDIALIPPMVGNLLIIISGDWFISHVGGYIYYIGLDIAIIALLRYTTDYCGINYRGTVVQRIVLALIAIDIVQLLLNPIFGHAFTMRETIVEGAPYYALVPYWGQVFHRVLVYGVFFASIAIFAHKTFTSPRVYLERYLVILIAMVITGAWESFYIFSGLPVDLSMIGFGAFGVLVFVLSLYYRPVLLLNGILARVVSDMGSAVYFFDRDHKCIYANAAGEKLLGNGSIDAEDFTEKLSDIVGQNRFDLDSEWTCRCQVSIGRDGEIQPVHASQRINRADTAFDNSDSSNHYWQLSMHLMDDDRQRRVGAFLTVHDRTSEEVSLIRERRAAEHDQLTGIYNSAHLYNTARRAMLDNPEVRYCVVGIDVREFKLINDIYSKEFGDEVLRTIAYNLKKLATPNEIYGRLTGDKFGFVLPVDEFDVENMEQRLSDESFKDQSITYPIILHMGVYEVVEEDLPLSVMFDRAFMAISSIKHDYSRRIAYYDDAMREKAIWNQRISAELDGAIANHEICPYLQPQVNEKGEVVGAEVLVRWIHPELGFLSPAKFIPFFEENGRIAQLDMFMWERACQILADWQKAGIDLFLSVNISPKDFYFVDVHETISSLVKKYGVDPNKLRLEITETVMMSDVENRLRIIENLRESGFLVEMDDFGSGYSSLNMLKDIPVDVLKIDMMFLYKTRDLDRAETILRTIIELSDQLGMPSVTEGVETADQLDMLTSMGCRMFQGYYFAKPMPLEEFEASYCNAA